MAKRFSKCFTHINSFNNCNGSLGTSTIIPILQVRQLRHLVIKKISQVTELECGFGI